MADYGIFRKSDAKRVARATKRVEGMPGTFLEVPERRGRLSVGDVRSNAGTGANGTPWTTAEYDAVSGDIVARFDRGIARSSLTPSIVYDTGCLLASDGYLYASGSTDLNRDNGIVEKWDTASPTAAVWASGRNSLTNLAYNDTTAGTNLGSVLIESESGFIWCSGSNSVASGTNSIARINTTTGLFTHSLGGTTTRYLLPCPTSGSVNVVPGIGVGNRISTIDNTGATTHNYTTAIVSRATHGNGTIALIDTAGTGLYTISATDLSAISNRTAPGVALYGAVATDGTTVWTMTTTEATVKYRWYGATSLGSEIGNANRSTGNANWLIYDSISSYLWANISSTLKRVDPSTGAEAFSVSLGSAVWGPTAIGIGTNFVVVALGGTGGLSKTILCIEKSSGSVRWYDYVAQSSSVSSFGVHVSSDDRVFISTLRRGP